MDSAASKDEDPRFMGKKHRRRSSAYKKFYGDSLGLQNSLVVLKTLALEGDKQVLRYHNKRSPLS